MLYLDANASRPMEPRAVDALVSALTGLPGNAHSPHRLGREAAAAVEDARARVGALLGRPARQVRFTSGATEANAWALRGLRAEAEERVGGPVRVLCSAVEHPSVLCHADERVPVDREGRIDLDGLERCLDRPGPPVSAVSLMAANNETGVLQPVAEALALCRRRGVSLHCDATQLPGRLPCHGLEADLLTISAHKLGGPKGIGALVGARPPRPLICGGPQERGDRAGTVAVPLVHAFGVAATLCQPMESETQVALEVGARRLGAQVLGEGAPRLPNTSALLFDQPGDLIVMALDLAGVCASTGAACASGAAEQSHVLAAMGLRGLPVRLSWQQGTPVLEVLPVLEAVLNRLRSHSASSP